MSPQAPNELLAVAGLSKVHVVDDDVAIPPSELAAMLAGFAGDLDDLDDLSKGLLQKHEDIDLDQIQAEVEQWSLAQRKTAGDSIRHALDMSEDPAAYAGLSDALGIQPTFTTPDVFDWDGLTADAIAETLYFIDLDLFNDGRKEGGFRVEKIFLAHPEARVILVSSHFTGDIPTLAELQEQAKLEGIRARPIAAISKTALQGGGVPLTNAIRRSIVAHRLQTVVARVKDLATQAHENGLQRLDEVDPFELEKVMVRFMQNEGEWAPSTVSRIYEAARNSRFENLLGTDDGLKTAATSVFDAKGIGDLEPEDSDQVISELAREERYQDQALLDASRRPIQCGNLFFVRLAAIGGNISPTVEPRTMNDEFSEFLLIGAACDLQLRHRKGATRKRNHGILVPLFEKSKRNDGHVLQPCFELKAFKDGDSKWVDVSKPILIDLRALDVAAAASLDAVAAGTDYVSLSPNDDPPSGAPPVVKDLWIAIGQQIQFFDDFRGAVRAAAGPAGLSTVDDMVQGATALGGMLKQVHQEQDGDEHRFFLKRTGHVREQFATRIWEHFLAYQARAAYPGDLVE